MTKEQIELIVAMLSGQQAATVHLAMLFAKQAGISKDDIAASFRNTGELLGQDVKNRETIITVLNHIAKGIETASPEHEKSVEEQIKSFLH